MNRKTSKHIVEASLQHIESLIIYIASSPKRKQVGDPVFNTDAIEPRIKSNDKFVKVDEAFRKLGELVKKELQNNFELEKKYKNEIGDKENAIRMIQQELDKTKSTLDEMKKEQQKEKEQSEGELKNKSQNEENQLVVQKDEELTEDVVEIRPPETKEVPEKNRMHTWLEQNALNLEKSNILKEQMTRIYGDTLNNLEQEHSKLLETLQYQEIKKCEDFKEIVASKKEEIELLLAEENNEVAYKYSELVSVLEEERDRLQKLVHARDSHEDPYVRLTLKQIDEILENTRELEARIDEFRGYRDDQIFLDLDHKLLDNIMRIDVMQVKGYDVIRQKRIEAIKHITTCTKYLEAKVIIEDNVITAYD